jgi:hypothetical protein
VGIDLSQSKLSKAAKKCIQMVLSYDNVCCQFLRQGDGWIEQLPLPDEALLGHVRVPSDAVMGKFILTHAKPIGEGTSGTVLRGYMAGRAVALKLQCACSGFCARVIDCKALTLVSCTRSAPV